MTSKLIISLVITAIISGGILLSFALQKPDSNTSDSVPQNQDEVVDRDQTTQDPNSQPLPSDSGGDSDSAVISAGGYYSYADSKFESDRNPNKVLFFYAAWCPSCRDHDAAIERDKAKIPDGVSIYKVNYDDSFELRRKYGVTLQHTFVLVDVNGEFQKTWNSLYKEYNLQSILDRVL